MQRPRPVLLQDAIAGDANIGLVDTVHCSIVWNPWINKTKVMSDMAPDNWKEMICVETADAADNAIHLSPGESHKLSVSIRVA